MNEILKSPELLPPLTLFEKIQNNETLLLVALAAAVSPFHVLFSTISVLFPLLLLSVVLFYVIYMSSPAADENVPLKHCGGRACVCVCVTPTSPLLHSGLFVNVPGL